MTVFCFVMKVRRGNYGERYSGGIGAQSALGVGYGGTNVAGSHFSGVTGPQVVFDSLALKTVSVPNNAFVSSYQVTGNLEKSRCWCCHHETSLILHINFSGAN